MLLSAYTSTVTLGWWSCSPYRSATPSARYRFPGARPGRHGGGNAPSSCRRWSSACRLLVLFSTAPGRWIESAMDEAGMSRYAATGIVLCQFLLSVPFAIGPPRRPFDDVDVRLEDLARTLAARG